MPKIRQFLARLPEPSRGRNHVLSVPHAIRCLYFFFFFSISDRIIRTDIQAGRFSKLSDATMLSFSWQNTGGRANRETANGGRDPLNGSLDLLIKNEN